MGQTLNGALTEEVRLENFSINHTGCSAICVFTCGLIQCSFCFFNFLACFSQEVSIILYYNYVSVYADGDCLNLHQNWFLYFHYFDNKAYKNIKF